MRIKIDENTEIEIREPKQKHLVRFLDMIQKLSESPDKVKDYIEFQQELIEELAGISKKEQEEMDLVVIEKIMDYIIERMMGAMGFAKLWQQQQSLLREAKEEL